MAFSFKYEIEAFVLLLLSTRYFQEGMISFIVIGKNEGWKLSQCIQSIIDTIEFNKIKRSEIIYVDSNSDDNSIKNVNQFSSVKIFKLTGDVNAAIARNVGAQESKGDILFFLDGDMEVIKESFLEIFDDNLELKYDFVSGDFLNCYYSYNDSRQILSKELHHKNKIITKESTTGGLFAIKKKIWLEIGGMREIFKRSQDMDLGLRLANKGIFLHRFPVNLANHHTVHYRSNKRLWPELMNSTHLYGRSLLYRKNLFNFNTYKLMRTQDYSLLIFIAVILISFLLRRIEPLFLYLIVIIIRSFKNNSFKYLFYFIMRDIRVFFGFFFFHPKKNKFAYESFNSIDEYSII